MTLPLTLLLAALKELPDILVLNKFGKVEAEGDGLRDALAKAVELEVPIVVGVPFRNLDQWRIFAGDMAEECSIDSMYLQRWLLTHDLLPGYQRLIGDIAVSRLVAH